MTTKLSEDQRRALRDYAGPVFVEDEQTQQRYVLVEQELHERAMQALRQQEDLAAIQAGIEDLEAGRYETLEAADQDIRRQLGFSPRTT